jgi:hypothetical protein
VDDKTAVKPCSARIGGTPAWIRTMNADELRAPLTDSERALLIGSCLESHVPLKIADPEVLARVAALLPDVTLPNDERAAS